MEITKCIKKDVSSRPRTKKILVLMTVVTVLCGKREKLIGRPMVVKFVLMTVTPHDRIYKEEPIYSSLRKSASKFISSLG